MKLYVFNVNNKNEFLNSIDVTEAEAIQWANVSTELQPPAAPEAGKSYAFNTETGAWDTLIDDWRGTTFYNVNNSLITMDGSLTPIPDDYTIVAPPDTTYVYKFVNNAWDKQPIETKSSLIEYTYQKKAETAYSGITIIKGGVSYLFETSQDSITMCNSTKIMLDNMPDDYEVNWKTWANGQPKFLTLTKSQFLTVFQFGLVVINQTFAVEDSLNAQILQMTTQNFKDQEFLNTFKNSVMTAFDQVNKTLDVDSPEFAELQNNI